MRLVCKYGIPSRGLKTAVLTDEEKSVLSLIQDTAPVSMNDLYQSGFYNKDLLLTIINSLIRKGLIVKDDVGNLMPDGI